MGPVEGRWVNMIYEQSIRCKQMVRVVLLDRSRYGMRGETRKKAVKLARGSGEGSTGCRRRRREETGAVAAAVAVAVAVEKREKGRRQEARGKIEFEVRGWGWSDRDAWSCISHAQTAALADSTDTAQTAGVAVRYTSQTRLSSNSRLRSKIGALPLSRTAQSSAVFWLSRSTCGGFGG